MSTRKRPCRACLIDREDGKCQDCGAPGGEAHHVIPRADGGTHALTNLKLLCFDCHRGSGWARNHPTLLRVPRPDKLKLNSPRKTLSKLVNFRCSESEHERLKQMAAAEDTNVSQLIKSRCFGDSPVRTPEPMNPPSQKIEIQKAPPAQRPKFTKGPRPTVGDLWSR